MKSNIIQIIRSKEKIAKEKIVQAQDQIRDFLRQTQEQARQIISKAAELPASQKQEIIKSIGEKALEQINQDKKNTQAELKELDQISLVKKDKTINLIISTILE